MSGRGFAYDKQQAIALLRNNKLEESRKIFSAICERDRSDMDAWMQLFGINARLGRFADAEHCGRQILKMAPKAPQVHFHLGCALLYQGKREEAVGCFRQAIALKPDFVDAYMRLGEATDSIDEALGCYRKAAGLLPRNPEIASAYASVLLACGEYESAIALMRKAIDIDTSLYKVHSSLLFALNYRSFEDPGHIYNEHVRWASLHALRPAGEHGNDPDPGKVLRVGYVSPDMREHSVAYFLEPLLASHNPDRVEVYCYSDVAHADEITRRFESLAHHWRPMYGMSDMDFIKRVREDAIDILIDLAGHTANNRLKAFSAKPAPVQMTYLGYPNTTGLSAIDYRITDAWADPIGVGEECYSEHLLRLPRGFLCYSPPADLPPIAHAPALRNGYVTFGSYNNLPKMGLEAVALWAAVLRELPDSVLLLKNYSLSGDASRKCCLKLFAEHGVGAQRLVFRGRDASIAGHLGSYGDMDIALDTHPYHGTTTTCEALIMGVPVITLAGGNHAGRVGVSILAQVGRSDLVACSVEDYVAIACRLAQDLDGLSAAREQLRRDVLASALCNATEFACDMEAAYRELWRRWCSRDRAT